MENQKEQLAGVISFPFEIGGFLKDTMQLDTLEVGVYLKLLIAHYQSGNKGLPNDDKKLSRIAGVSNKVWSRIKPTILEYFYIENNNILHEKVIEVLRKVHEKSSKQRDKALKRHNSTHATAKPQHCQPKPKTNIYRSKIVNIHTSKPVDNVDNSKGSFKKNDSLVCSVGSFDIRNYLKDDDYIDICGKINSNWDRNLIFEKYNNWVKNGEKPKNPRKAFFGWLDKNASWLKVNP